MNPVGFYPGFHTNYRLSAETLVNIPSYEVDTKPYSREFSKELRETICRTERIVRFSASGGNPSWAGSCHA